MSFSEQLKKARLESGYTQQQVADMMGITNSTYCGYETGKRQPDVEKIRIIAKLLNTSGDFLLETGFDSQNTDTAPTQIEQELSIEDIRLLALPATVKQTMLQLVDQLTDISSLPVVTPTEIGTARVRKALAEADAQAADGAKQDDRDSAGPLRR